MYNENVRNQIEKMIMGEQEEKKQRGGKREGAGRDPKFAGRISKPVRIPEDYIPFVQLLISELDKHPAFGLNDNDKPMGFDPIAITSKSGRRQQVRFLLEKLNNDKGDVRFPRIVEEDTGRVNAKGEKITKSKLVIV